MCKETLYIYIYIGNCSYHFYFQLCSCFTIIGFSYALMPNLDMLSNLFCPSSFHWVPCTFWDVIPVIFKLKILCSCWHLLKYFRGIRTDCWWRCPPQSSWQSRLKKNKEDCSFTCLSLILWFGLAYAHFQLMITKFLIVYLGICFPR